MRLGGILREGKSWSVSAANKYGHNGRIEMSVPPPRDALVCVVEPNYDDFEAEFEEMVDLTGCFFFQYVILL